MKYDYDKMKINEIRDVYYDVYGDYYQIQLGDEDDHREDIIACIERGYPQKPEEIGPWRECVIY